MRNRNMEQDELSPFIAKARAEVHRLQEAGITISGNAFSALVFVACGLDERGCHALKAGYQALGLPPEKWCVLDWNNMLAATQNDESNRDYMVRLALCTLASSVVVCCDNASAQAIAHAYQPALQLNPGDIQCISGFSCLALGDFSAALADEHAKQRAWFYLKRLKELMRELPK